MSTSSPRLDTRPTADAAGLLRELVRTPSPSGEEEQAAAVLCHWARGHGLAVQQDATGVRIVVAGRAPGATLLLASHLDTVPVGDGWQHDPYAADEEQGVLYGRGAVDAKASVAAMVAAAAEVARGGGPACGRLVVLATRREEVRHPTMPEALEQLGAPPDAAVVGEPTSLRPCIAQRGLLILRLVWHGEQVHAGWVAARTPAPPLAITRAARDLVRLGELKLARVHPLLGAVSVTPTSVQAGVARNMTPPVCEAIVDVRTTPAYSHEEITATIGEHVDAEVEVVSSRLQPAQTPAGSRLLAAVREVTDAAPFASPTASDWVHLRHVDAIKLGPGDSRLSHTADEHIAIADVQAAATLYAELSAAYLRPGA